MLLLPPPARLCPLPHLHLPFPHRHVGMPTSMPAPPPLCCTHAHTCPPALAHPPACACLPACAHPPAHHACLCTHAHLHTPACPHACPEGRGVISLEGPLLIFICRYNLYADEDVKWDGWAGGFSGSQSLQNISGIPPQNGGEKEKKYYYLEIFNTLKRLQINVGEDV